MSKLSTFITTWGQKSLGQLLRDWWRKEFPEPTGPRYPWTDEIQKEIERPDALRVCHRCLTPQEHLGWFCPECGAATGPYNNCMPFVYIFSLGEVLRAGVDEKTKFAKWVYPLYFLVGIFEYLLFCPLYWIRLILAQKRRSSSLEPADYENEN